MTDRVVCIKVKEKNRNKAEDKKNSNGFIQLVVGALIINDSGELMIYRRKSSDKRMDGKLSCIIGGHLEKTPESFDFCSSSVIKDELRREIIEELGIKDFSIVDKCFHIYTDEDEVSSIHYGVIFPVYTHNKELNISSEIDEYTFMSPYDAEAQDLEAWSLIALSKYISFIKANSKKRAKSNGKKYDEGKPDFSLVYPKSITKLAEVLTFGKNKYGEDSWKSLDNAKNRYYSALMRHLFAYKSGEKYDEESNLTHLAHAFANLHFLMFFEDEE